MERKSLADLLVDVPSQLIGLVKAEIASLKNEVTGKAKKLGVGVGLLAGAGVLAIFMIAWLMTAGFEALTLVFARWLAALLVAAFLLLVIAILVLIALPMLQSGKSITDLDAMDSVKDDVNMVRGLGHAADGTDPLSDLPTAPRVQNGGRND